MDWMLSFVDSPLCLSMTETGQIELFSHMPVMKRFIQELKDMSFTVCCVYLLDSQFVADPTKFISGMLSALAAMIQLETPHINVLTKCDLLECGPSVRDEDDGEAEWEDPPELKKCV